MPPKLLVVDDEPDLQTLVRQKFRRQIRDEELEFVFAQSGVEALSRLDEHPDICMVLSDINMPEMDGLTLLGKILERRNPLLKTVVVSAYGDMENIRTAMNRGAFDFVTKPIDFTDLEATIGKTLNELEALRKAAEDHNKLMAVQRELSVAARIQQNILPRKYPPFPDRPELEIFGNMIPAKEVGGDFFDFFFLDDDRLAFVIGDVSGKGMPAALFMAVSHTLLRAVAPQADNPGDCLQRVNQMLIPGNDAGLFVTVFYAVLDTRTGQLQFCNGGHNLPFVARTNGAVESVGHQGSVFLGVVEGLEYGVEETTLAPGETIFLYTDGVSEAMNVNQEMFTEERLQAHLASLNGTPLQTFFKETSVAIAEHVGAAPQSDDLTMLGVRYLGKT